MGLSRSADGLLTVAVRTDLHGCKGACWTGGSPSLRTRSTSTGGTHTITSNTAAGIATGKGESYVGASIEAVEWLAELPPVAARLKFHAAEDFFAPQPLRRRATRRRSAAVCARIGFGDRGAG